MNTQDHLPEDEQMEDVEIQPVDDEVYEAMLDRLEIVFQDFLDHELYLSLPEAEQENTDSILNDFAEYALNIYGTEYGEWTLDTTHDVLLNWMPANLPEIPDYFELQIPVLVAFFSFLAEQKLNTEAAAIAKSIPALQAEILRKAADPEEWTDEKLEEMAEVASLLESEETNMDPETIKFLEDMMEQAKKNGFGAPPSDN